MASEHGLIPWINPHQNASKPPRHVLRHVADVKDYRASAERQKLIIPGYTNLYQFSADQESLLKRECGGAWRSYSQRANWRLVFPFMRRGQEKTAEKLATSLTAGRLALIHLARFPQQTINHALLAYRCEATPSQIAFFCYDPNLGAQPTVVTFVRKSRTFELQPNHYFGGGRVDVYEIYRNAWF